MVTLGADLSLSGTGWAIMDDETLLASGTIRTKPDDGNDAERNAIIVAGLLTAVKACAERVTLMGVETQFAGGGGEGFRARAGAAMRVAAVRGAVSMLGPMLSIQVVEVSPAEGKRALTGSGKATKKQMQAAVLRDFGVALAQDAADACGIARAAITKVQGRKTVKEQARQVRPEVVGDMPDHVKAAMRRGQK